MAPEALPVQIVLSEPQYLALLKRAPPRSRVMRRLIEAVEDDRIGRRKGSYVFTGLLTDGLALRAVALMHAPEAVSAIEHALKRAPEE